MYSNPGPVLGCLAMAFVSAEGAIMCHLVPAGAIGMLGNLLESKPVKHALALSPGQAIVTRHQGLQPTHA